jgi:hypothetical protein
MKRTIRFPLCRSSARNNIRNPGETELRLKG